MLAIEVAALRTFPKEIIQLVELGFLFAEIVMESLEHQQILIAPLLETQCR